MAIANQKHINVGLPNESANSDSLYTAFNKINDNFDELFANAAQISAGNGISIGNGYPQTITANIAAGNNISVAVVNSAIQINAIVERYASNSTSNISVSTGSKSITVGTGLSYTPGQVIVVAYNNDSYMTGTVSSYNANTGSLSFSSSNAYGNLNAYYQNWSINLTGAAAGGSGLYGIIPGNGILINSSNVTGAYSGNATLSLGNSGVTAATYTNPTITVDSTGRVITASNNTVSGTVTSVGLSPGTGIQITGGPITGNGLITVTNTGVTRLTAGTGITLTGSTGNITIGTQTGGTVTFANISSNSLTVAGGPITSAGTINVELPNNISVSGNITTTAGNVSANIITANSYIKTLAVTFAALPSAATAGAGARAFITDGNLAVTGNFGAQVTGGAGNNVPVYSDGTDWRIG